MKVERSNFILVPNSAQSTNVFLQSKCNMHGRYGHVSWSWRSYIAQLEPSSEPGGGYFHRNAVRGCAAQMGRFLTKNP